MVTAKISKEEVVGEILDTINAIESETNKIFKFENVENARVSDMYSNLGSYLFCKVLRDSLKKKGMNLDIVVSYNTNGVKDCYIYYDRCLFDVHGIRPAIIRVQPLTEHIIKHLDESYTVSTYLQNVLKKVYKMIPSLNSNKVDTYLYLYLLLKLAQ